MTARFETEPGGWCLPGLTEEEGRETVGGRVCGAFVVRGVFEFVIDPEPEGDDDAA